MVADGAFIAHHVDPDETDLRAAFDLMPAAAQVRGRFLG
jgi:hypothetical protein